MKITRRPAFFMAISLTAGIISSNLFIKNQWFLSLKIIAVVEIIYFLFYLFFRLKKSKKSIYTSLMILFLILGTFLYANLEYEYQNKFSIKNFSDLNSAKILAELVFDLGDLESNKLFLKPYFINGRKVKHGRILVNSKLLKTYKDGDLINLELDTALPAVPLNPGAFDYLQYLKGKGVYLQGWNLRDV